eukprot:239412_1
MEAKAISTIQSGVPYYLPINAGEKLTIIGKDEDWYFCKNKNGMIGKIPTSFARPTNKVSTNKSLACKPTLTPPLSPTFIAKVQNGFFDEINKNNQTIIDNISDIELEDEIEGAINKINNKSQTLMGQNIDAFINPNNNKNSKISNQIIENNEHKIDKICDDDSVINGLTIQNPFDIPNHINIDNDSVNVINNTQTIMGFEQNNQLLKFKNNNNDNDILHKGVTLMGMNENDNIQFMDLKEVNNNVNIKQETE